MSTITRLAAAAAIGVIAVGGAALLAGNRDGVDPAGSSPTPVGSAASPVTGFASEFAYPFAFSAPAGWRVKAASTGAVGIAPPLDTGSMSRDVSVWLDPLPVVDACGQNPATGREVTSNEVAESIGLRPVGVSRTAAGIADWLTSHPGLVTSTPQAVVIDDMAALALDVRKDPAVAGACLEGGQVMLFALPPDALTWWPSDDYTNRLLLFDGPGGHVIAINVSSGDRGGFPAFLSEAMAVVESFEFEPAPTTAASTGNTIVMPVLDDTFVSECYGFSVGVPMLWPVSPATDLGCPGLAGMDIIEGATAALHAASEPLESWRTGPEWIANHVGRYGQCDGALWPGSEILIGDVTWTIVKGGCPSRVLSDHRSEGAAEYEVVTVVGDRRYVFWLHDLVDEAMLRAILATVRLEPAGAVDPSPSPTPS
jgi:hypothetical protein